MRKHAIGAIPVVVLPVLVVGLVLLVVPEPCRAQAIPHRVLRTNGWDSTQASSDRRTTAVGDISTIRHRQATRSLSFASSRQYISGSRNWMEPVTCDVQGPSITGSQLRYRSAGLLAYSNQACNDAWNRLLLSGRDSTLQRGNRNVRSDVRRGITSKSPQSCRTVFRALTGLRECRSIPYCKKYQFFRMRRSATLALMC
jgi:hypothetical protein